MVTNIIETLRDDLSIQDLAYLSALLHKHKPETRDRVVIGVQKPLPTDVNVKFVMSPRSNEEPKEYSIVMIAAQWILDIQKDIVDT